MLAESLEAGSEPLWGAPGIPPIRTAAALGAPSVGLFLLEVDPDGVVRASWRSCAADDTRWELQDKGDGRGATSVDATAERVEAHHTGRGHNGNRAAGHRY